MREQEWIYISTSELSPIDFSSYISSNSNLNEEHLKANEFIFSLPSFYLKQNNLLFKSEYTKIHIQDLIDQFSQSKALSLNLAPAPTAHNPASEINWSFDKLSWQEPQFEDYDKVFSKAQIEFKQNQLRKIVPVVFETATQDMSIEKIKSLFVSILKTPKNQHAYGYSYQGQGMMGCSPELLLKVDSQKLSTMALAGTQSKAASKENTLLQDSKELKEHELVIEDIKYMLNYFSNEPVEVSKTYVQELPHLWHLKTDIYQNINSKKSPKEYLKQILKMHPTPALGVAPREYNFQNMQDFESPVDREYYGAPFSILMNSSDLQVLSIVAIRNIQWNQNQIKLGSGAGVIEQSEVQKEWQELKAKRNSVKKIFL